MSDDDGYQEIAMDSIETGTGDDTVRGADKEQADTSCKHINLCSFFLHLCSVQLNQELCEMRLCWSSPCSFVSTEILFREEKSINIKIMF